MAEIRRLRTATSASGSASSSASGSASGSASLRQRGVIEPYPLIDVHALVGRVGARRVEVGEGELLYIPPYWAHAVVSPEPSVALASFSTSWEQARWARSAWHLAPLGRFAAGGVCSKARGAALITAAFLHALTPRLEEAPTAFLANVFTSRFAPLYGNLPGGNGGPSAKPDPPTIALGQCLAVEQHMLPFDAPERDDSLRHRLAMYASSVASLLTQPDPSAGGRQFARGVARELAADYVEELAGWACGAEGAWRLLALLATTEELNLDHAAQPWRQQSPHSTVSAMSI
uniref:JmjC domain-containing protein n=1 Tax=Haptolina brevifila TaxID=156173 RepID=A0A6U7DNC8_9EUKA|mmetsp:Transcript_26607/g.53453  ORF Transcript_26607/g.53453 Transcript_26607/m.53453 type:complete len:289 (+) Transcript_26607:985-1851(+)